MRPPSQDPTRGERINGVQTKVLGEAGVWIGAYAEFAFLKQSWQSFTSDDLDGLLEDYGMRERRFGAVGTVGAGAK